MRRRIAEQLDERLASELSDGDSHQTAAGANPDGDELDSLVDVARRIRRIAPRPAPSPARQDRALAELRTALAQARLANAATPAAGSRIRGRWFVRPALLQAAAVLGAIMLLSGALIGASATGADISQPIRALFSSESSVKLEGVIRDVRPDSIVVQTADESLIVTFADNAQILNDGKNVIDLDDLLVGQTVELKGTRQADGTILGALVKVEADVAPGDER